MTKLSLNHEKQFAHHGGKAHYQYVHENQHRWAHGYHAEVAFLLKVTPKGEMT